MEDLGLIVISGKDLVENLDKALAEDDPKPWAFVKRLRQMQGLTAGTWLAWVELIDEHGRQVNRFTPSASVLRARRVVLGRLMSGVNSVADPFFSGYPFEFRFDGKADETFDQPMSVEEVTAWLNARVSDLDLAPDQFTTLVGHAKSNKVGLFIDGAPRTASYFDPYPQAASEEAAAPTSPTEPAPTPVTTDLGRAVDEFVAAVDSAGLRFAGTNADLPRAFVASIVAKRFVLLSGLSGSGKTLLARAFGQWLGDDDEAGPRHLLVPVRPDWTSPEPLLGYEDGLLPIAKDGRRAWHVPDVLHFMLNAARRPEHLWLLILDEMNLAHVERYFADVLSGIESGEPVLPNLRGEPDGFWRLPPDGERRVPLPPNLVVVGTVNVDETTYQFSPKVLDRAFSFEFRVASEELDGRNRRPTRVPATSGDRHKTLLGACQEVDAHLDDPLPNASYVQEQLVELHRELSAVGFEFGHRTYFEALRYARLLNIAGVSDPDTALDWIVMTKVLPRLHGSRRQLEPLLEALHETAAGTDAEGASMPRTAAKVSRMLTILQANQFVSFAE